jgi:hypothetical protein
VEFASQGAMDVSSVGSTMGRRPGSSWSDVKLQLDSRFGELGGARFYDVPYRLLRLSATKLTFRVAFWI